MHPFKKMILSKKSSPVTPPDPVGTYFGFVRDGTQQEGNDTFHKPRVEYTDTDGNPQIWYLSMDSLNCSFIMALSIDYHIYCHPCT